MEKKILAIGAGVGAAMAALQTGAIMFADQFDIVWLVPIAIVSGLVNMTLGAFLAAYRANS